MSFEIEETLPMLNTRMNLQAKSVNAKVIIGKSFMAGARD